MGLASLLVGGCNADSDRDGTDEETRAFESTPCADGACETLDGSLGAGPLDAGVRPEPADAGPADAASQPAIPVPLFLGDVVANGTGCPPGTWKTTLSNDGRSFAVTFSGYEAQINDQTTDLSITRNCQLAVSLYSPEGVSYAVRSFRFEGYAFLEQGVTATVSARPYFAGNPVPPANSHRVMLTGPFDQDFVYAYAAKTSDMVWSPCGTKRELNISSMLQLRNSSPKRSGYANLAAFDGSTALTFTLDVRPCRSTLPPPILPGSAGVLPRP